VETPNQPRDPDTPRVALVVSENRRNYSKDDYIVVPAFSRGNLGPTRVFLPAGQGGVDHDSILFCDEVCCLDEDLLDFETGPLGGTVDSELLDEVVVKIRRAVGDVVPLQPGEEYPHLPLS
jgi:mRNA-degrading endonuclease toxin of MazEF toxin-antitoxin module